MGPGSNPNAQKKSKLTGVSPFKIAAGDNAKSLARISISEATVQPVLSINDSMSMEAIKSSRE